MKRTASAICAAMLSVALAACGGAQDSSTAAKEDSSPTATEDVVAEEKDAKAEGADESGKAKEAAEEAADPTEKFLGEWKPCAMVMGGQALVGDIDKAFQAESEDTKGYMRVSEDGTGVVHSPGAPADTIVEFTWELVGDDELRAVNKPAAGAEDATETVTTFAYRDGELVYSWQDEDGISECHYSRDGTTNAFETYDLAKATKITDAKGLVGTWNPIAVKNDGTMMSGDLSDMGSLNEPCEFREDGTATVMGEDNFTWTWEVGEDGATLVVEGLGLPCRVLAYDNKIIVDYSAMEALTGGMGEGMQIVYAR